MQLQKFDNSANFLDAGINFIKQACQTNPQAHIALSGGSTPRPLYAVLPDSDINFSETEFYQVDERYIPATDPDSNQKMIRETLQPTNFTVFDTSLSIKDSLKKYQEDIEDITFDLCILGIGTDGHTASLFPHCDDLHTQHTVAHTKTHEFAVNDRLTLTFQKILPSKKLLVLLKGEKKAAVLEKIQKSETNFEDFPAKKLLQHPDLTVLFLQ